MSDTVTTPATPRAPLLARVHRAVAARLTWEWPPVRTTLAVGVGTAISLAPGLLPRTAAAQSLLTVLLVLLGLGVARLVRVAAVRVAAGDAYPSSARTRRLVCTATAAGVLGAAVYAGVWQNTLRSAMGRAPAGPGYWASWLIGSILLSVVLALVAIGVGRALRRIGWSRLLVMTVVAGLPLALFGMPAVVGWGDQAYAAANAAVDPNLVQPVTMTRSGSTESMVSWSSLGREGQRFVTAGPPGAVHVYVGLRSAPDLAARADLAVRELERAGGFDRSHLVVAVPTGSGWVDARALRGFGDRFGGDVAVVALQYSYAPSWATFVFGRHAAAASAQALVAAVEQRLATMDRPPRLYLYGQSLGALGGSAVFAGAADQNHRVCSALWAGMPGGGSPAPGSRTVMLANSSDPVVHWSLDLLWRRPDLTAARRDAPTPPWLPVASFVQTTADLLGALGAPPGHGHRYDIDQGTALPDCTPAR
ncbi:alpha/beta-hydrolase family protein [Nocardia sp. NBC_00416]|uniref:alpha/beta-hydrolase family protein n=1 Tax=Nocardia sp. NBC_00416 TaxID=2975991 RepID=UPI002E23394E